MLSVDAFPQWLDETTPHLCVRKLPVFRSREDGKGLQCCMRPHRSGRERHGLKPLFHRKSLDDGQTRPMGHDREICAGVAIGVSLEKSGRKTVGAV